LLLSRSSKTPGGNLRISRWTPRAAWLGRRTRVRWAQFADTYRDQFDIPSQALPQTYRRFIASFRPKKMGRFKVQMRKGASEAPIMLAITNWTTRKLGRSLRTQVLFREGPLQLAPHWFRELKIFLPSNPFRIQFALTSVIEPRLNLPLDPGLPAGVCVAMGMQGPKKIKFENTMGLVREIDAILGDFWQNFLLCELIAHARAQGCQAVAFLRPEHNPALRTEKLHGVGLGDDDIQSIHSQHYAAAKHNHMRKIKNSKFLWFFLGRLRELNL